MSDVWRNQKEGKGGEGRRAGGREGRDKENKDVEDEEKKVEISGLWVELHSYEPPSGYNQMRSYSIILKNFVLKYIWKRAHRCFPKIYTLSWPLLLIRYDMSERKFETVDYGLLDSDSVGRYIIKVENGTSES